MSARVVFGKGLAAYFLAISQPARQEEQQIKGDVLFYIFLFVRLLDSSDLNAIAVSGEGWAE